MKVTGGDLTPLKKVSKFPVLTDSQKVCQKFLL